MNVQEHVSRFCWGRRGKQTNQGVADFITEKPRALRVPPDVDRTRRHQAPIRTVNGVGKHTRHITYMPQEATLNTTQEMYRTGT